jgi:SAM-dependent methyltransferase
MKEENGQVFSLDRARPGWWPSIYSRIVFFPYSPGYPKKKLKTPLIKNVNVSWDRIHAKGEYSDLWGVAPDAAIEELLSAIHVPPFPVFLDAGCGTGRHFDSIHKRFPDAVWFGFDISMKALQRQSESASRRLFIANILQVPIKHSSIDCIIDYGLFHTIPPWLRPLYIFQIVQLLRERGIIILASWIGNSNKPVYRVRGTIPEWGVSTESISLLFGEDWRIEKSIIKEYDRSLYMNYLLIQRNSDSLKIDQDS